MVYYYYYLVVYYFTMSYLPLPSESFEKEARRTWRTIPSKVTMLPMFTLLFSPTTQSVCQLPLTWTIHKLYFF